MNIKILNVLAFYESIAFMLKIMENLVGAIAPVMIFLIGIIFIFSLCLNSLDIIYFNLDSPVETGDYKGFLGIYGASMMSTLRNSLGDFDVGTYKFLPRPQKSIIWLLWLAVIMLNNLVVMNLNIQVIETVLKSVNNKRVEEAYQKKCGVLCDLNSVFGKMAKRKTVNVLITRLSTDEKVSESSIDKSAIALKKLIAKNKIEVLKNIDDLHRTATQRNTAL